MHEFGVYIGRFQPFHTAHLEKVRFALQWVNNLIMVIGSDNQARTIKNPFSTAERKEMIRAAVGKELSDRITFVAARDYLYNDNLWITAVQRSVSDVIENINANKADDVVLIGHHKDASSFYLKLFPQWKYLDGGMTDTTSATKIRQLYFELDKIGIKNFVPASVNQFLLTFMDSPEFSRLHEEYHHILNYRAQWEGAPFPPVFVTTDAVVIRSGHVLVVRRRASPGKGLIALPGGYLQQNEKIIDGCVRELKEETGIKLPASDLKEAICDNRVFDHPQRSLRGRTITHASCINLGHGELPQVKGMDDADKAWWMALRDVFSQEDKFFEDHFHIISYFVNRF